MSLTVIAIFLKPKLQLGFFIGDAYLNTDVQLAMLEKIDTP
jgi:hypothetical protein